MRFASYPTLGNRVQEEEDQNEEVTTRSFYVADGTRLVNKLMIADIVIGCAFTLVDVVSA